MDTLHLLLVRTLMANMGRDLLTAANALIAANSELAFPFVVGEGMRYIGAGSDVPRRLPWFSRQTSNQQTPSDKIVGYSRTLRFDGAVAYIDQTDFAL